MSNPSQQQTRGSNPEGDVTGELTARKKYDEYLARFDALLKEAFADTDITFDKDLVDMLTDEMHERIDLSLTAFYENDSDDGLEIDDEDS